MPSGRKQEYRKMDEKFLPRLNEELRELWLKVDQIDQLKPHLAGPSRVRGQARRLTLVRARKTIAAVGAATSLDTVYIPLNGATCIDGAPSFTSVDWVGGVDIQLVGLTMSGNYAAHTIEIAKFDEEKVILDVFRDYTGGTVPAWDAVFMFQVSGTVSRV